MNVFTQPNGSVAHTQKYLDLQKNPTCSNLLNKLAQTEKITEELEKVRTSPEFNQHELYLRYLLSGSLIQNEDEKLVLDWMKTILAFSSSYDPSKAAAKFNRALEKLDFQHAFALAVAAYRIALLPNEPKNDFATIAFAASIEKLIQEHPSDYHALELNDLSLQSKALRFDVSTVPQPFLIELSDQQKVPDDPKNMNWFRLIIISVLGSAALYATANYFTRETKPVTPPTLLDHINNHWDKIALSISAFTVSSIFFWSRKAKKDIIASLSLKEIQNILNRSKSNNDFSIDGSAQLRAIRSPFKFNAAWTGRTFNLKFEPQRLTISKENLGLSKISTKKINICFRELNKEEYLIIHIHRNKVHYLCGFKIKDYNMSKETDFDYDRIAFNNNQIQIPFKVD